MSIHQRDPLAQPPCAGENCIASQPPLASILIAVNRNFVGKLKDGSPDWERHTTTFRPEVLSVTGIADAIQAGHTLTAAHHTRRTTENYISAQHIGIDGDHSSLSELLNIPLVQQYFAVVHSTTSSTPEAPRSRAIGILDAPIYDARQYVRLVTALLWKLALADPYCKDACRNWFGAKGCDMVVRPDLVLPVAGLEEIAQEHDAWLAEQERTQNIDPTIDPTEALDIAIRNGTPGHRNITGFWLACRLRDSGMSIDQARAVMATYQMAVGEIGDHPYTQDEANKALRSAYSRRPRGHSAEQVERVLSLFESVGWRMREGLKEGGIHYSLKTLMAVSEIARRAGRTQGLDLPVRDFNAYGVPRVTAGRHLKSMLAAGLLKRDRKSNRLRATTYSINLSVLYEAVPNENRGRDGTIKEHSPQVVLDCPIPAPIFNVHQSATYHRLQSHAHFRHRARVDCRLWVGEPPDGDDGLGPALQRIIATLAECSVRSKGELYRLSDVNQRTGKNKLRVAIGLGLVSEEYNPEDSRAKCPYLVDNWYELLCEIEPAMTTYGHDALLAVKYETERLAHFDPDPTHKQNRRHYNLIRTLKGSDEELAQNAAQNARERLELHRAQIDRFNERRRAWAASQGITGDVPGISLMGPPRAKRVQQPVPVARAGRYVIPQPSHVKTGPNRPLKHERADYIPPLDGLEPEIAGAYDARTGMTTWVA